MAGGTIQLTTSGSGSLEGRIVWESISNGTAANSSTVTAQLQVYKPNGYTTSGTWKGSLTVGSVTQEISRFESVGGDWFTLAEVTATVSHNAGGSGTCYLYGKIDGPTETTVMGTSVSGSATVTLEAIARFASLLSAPDFHDEENPGITFSNPAGNSVTSLEVCISLDGQKADIAYRTISNKRGSSYTFYLTEAERNVLRAATADGNSRSVYFMLRSAVGGVSGISSLSRTFTVKDPKPILAPTLYDSNDVTYALTRNRSKLIRYYSDAYIWFGASAVKQATIKSQKVTCGSKSLTADGYIYGVESGSFVFTVTDSRGNTVTETVSAESGHIQFVDYIKLTCDLENNMPDTNGDMEVKVSGNYFNGSFGAEDNSLQVYYRYKPAGGTFGDWAAMTVAIGDSSYTAAASISGLDYKTTYAFEAYAVDALATVYSSEKAVKATPVFDWGEHDFRFNVPVEMSGNRISNLGVPEADGDALPLGYARAAFAAADTALTMEAAAEAFAPAGYGLGEEVVTAEDLDAVKSSGWYRWDESTQNTPFAKGIILVLNRGNQVIQLAFDPYLNGSDLLTVCMRGYYDGYGWDPWEYINPPLREGVEYRTAERWNRKTVYVKLVNLGQLPGPGSVLEVPIPFEEGDSAASIVRLTAGDSEGSTIPYTQGMSTPISTISASTDKIVFSTADNAEADYSGCTGWAALWYTKN